MVCENKTLRRTANASVIYIALLIYKSYGCCLKARRVLLCFRLGVKRRLRELRKGSLKKRNSTRDL